MKKLIDILLNLTLITNFTTLVASCTKPSHVVRSIDDKKSKSDNTSKLIIKDLNLKVNSIEEVDNKDKLFTVLKREVTYSINWQYALKINNEDYEIKTEGEIEDNLTKDKIESAEFKLVFNIDLPKFTNIDNVSFKVTVDIESQDVVDSRINLASINNKVINIKLDIPDSLLSSIELSDNVKSHIISNIKTKYHVDVQPEEIIVNELNNTSSQFTKDDISSLTVSASAQVNSQTIKGTLSNITFAVTVENETVDNRIDLATLENKKVKVQVNYANSTLSVNELKNSVKEHIVDQLKAQFDLDVSENEIKVNGLDDSPQLLNISQISSLTISASAQGSSQTIRGTLSEVTFIAEAKIPKTNISGLNSKIVNMELDYENSTLSLDNVQTEVKRHFIKEIFVTYGVTVSEKDIVVSNINEKDNELNKEKLSNLDLSVAANDASDKIIGSINNIKINVNIKNKNTYYQSIELRKDYYKNYDNEVAEFDLNDKSEIPQNAKNIKVKKAIVSLVTKVDSLKIRYELNDVYRQNLELIIKSENKKFKILSKRESINCLIICYGDMLSVWSDDLGWDWNNRASDYKNVVGGKLQIYYVGVNIGLTYEL